MTCSKILTTFPKDPHARLDYSIDWSQWLSAGEAISCSVWTIESGINSFDQTATTSIATVWLDGGTAGITYQVANKIVTTGSRTDERTIKIKVLER